MKKRFGYSHRFPGEMGEINQNYRKRDDWGYHMLVPCHQRLPNQNPLQPEVTKEKANPAINK